MKCLRCQQENPEGQKFCGDCGTPLQPVGGSAQPAPSYAALQRSLTEALEQQTATSQILRVISSSPTDVQPIFEAIAESAARLCEALDVSIFRVDGDRLAFVAHQGPIAQRHGDFSLPLVRGTVGGRSMLESRTVQVADLQNEDGEFPDAVENARRFGFRTILSVPLLREGIAIGGIQLRRTEVQLFTDQKIALLQTFADQAVIAIENVRLFKELEARNRDLTVSLDRQTATADVLRIIAQSPSQLQPVLDAIAASAVRLLRARSGTLSRIVGDQIELAAHTSTDNAGDAATRASFPQPLSFGGVHAQTIRNRAPLNIADAQTDPRLPEATHTYAQVRGYRSQGAVPMLRHDEVVGAIAVARREPGGFTDDEIALLRTFADQAVIAIENVRLFTQLEARNSELRVALDQQTATSEILRVISSSPTDLQPVFDTIVRNAARVCEAFDAVVVLADGEESVQRAHHGPIAAVLGARYPLRSTVVGRAILEARVVHVENLAEAPDYPAGRELAQRVGYRTTLSVPLLRDGAAIGAIGLRRTEVHPFTDKQIALLQTFADQAVIAIENVRLFKELETRNADLTEALDRQTGTAEILRVISSSPTDVQPVFDAIAAKALELCRATTGWVYRFDGELINIAAAHSLRPEAVEVVRQSYPMPPSRGGASARAVLSRSVVYIPDIREDHEYRLEALAKAADYSSVLAVPMLLEGKPIGVITVTGAEAGAFSQRQIELLQTFADQAVIAIENVRLFTELQARNRAVTEALEQQTATSAILRVIAASPTDVRPILDTIVENAGRVCDAEDATLFLADGAEVVLSAYHGGRGLGTLPMDLRLPLTRETANGRAILDAIPIHVHDLQTDQGFPLVHGLSVRLGTRSALAVPLIRDGAAFGSILIRRTEVRPFSDRHIELLKTFADQAVIAIENVRLFTELRASNREIADKSHQLEIASQHKSEFLANMSHELRTPLNAIIGFSEVLSEGMFGGINEKQTEYLGDILESGRHLLSLINDILDLSKIEAGRMELELADFDLPQAIENALVLVRERALRRGITLEQSIDSRLGEIQGDERKIKQVLLNLLSNAIKFTPEGGKIEIRAVPHDEVVEVSVSDTGVGIAPEDQEAVFEEFRQVGTAERKVEGTGLGLALALKFIELHGGRIWLKSQVGVGSTFTFTLPVRRGE